MSKNDIAEIRKSDLKSGCDECFQIPLFLSICIVSSINSTTLAATYLCQRSRRCYSVHLGRRIGHLHQVHSHSPAATGAIACGIFSTNEPTSVTFQSRMLYTSRQEISEVKEVGTYYTCYLIAFCEEMYFP